MFTLYCIHCLMYEMSHELSSLLNYLCGLPKKNIHRKYKLNRFDVNYHHRTYDDYFDVDFIHKNI